MPADATMARWGFRALVLFRTTILRNHTLRILYVEDNQELRETIAMLMEGDGRSITT